MTLSQSSARRLRTTIAGMQGIYHAKPCGNDESTMDIIKAYSIKLSPLPASRSPLADPQIWTKLDQFITFIMFHIPIRQQHQICSRLMLSLIARF
jgi:hypothetical protein